VRDLYLLTYFFSFAKNCLLGNLKEEYIESSFKAGEKDGGLRG
jgi:hypothetical protein